jgi:hypothetical protein
MILNSEIKLTLLYTKRINSEIKLTLLYTKRKGYENKNCQSHWVL